MSKDQGLRRLSHKFSQIHTDLISEGCKSWRQDSSCLLGSINRCTLRALSKSKLLLTITTMHYSTQWQTVSVRYTLVCRRVTVLSMLSVARHDDKLKCIEH